MAGGLQLLRLNDDMLLEILKKIKGIELEKIKQTCSRIINLARDNSKALCNSNQRGLKIIFYVDRWQKDKLRVQQYRNYLPEFRTDHHVIRLRAMPISHLYMSFQEAEGPARFEQLVEILTELRPICGYLDMKGIPIEFVAQITNLVDCQNEITVHQNTGDVQLLITTLKSLPYANKFKVNVENNRGQGVTINGMFEQIKCFNSYHGPCTAQTFKDFVSDLYETSDYGSLKMVSLSVHHDNHNDDLFGDESMPATEIFWNSALLPDGRRDSANPKIIRKFESKEKFFLIKEREYGSIDIHILEKKLSNVVDTLMQILGITNMSEDLRDEFYIAQEDRQRQIILEAFLAMPIKQKKEDEDDED